MLQEETGRHSAVVLHGGFIVSGAATVILGPLIPDLALRLHLAAATLGSLFLIQFAASAMGAVLSSGNLQRSLLVGYGLMAFGLAGLTLGWPAVRGTVAVLGLGLGLSIPATNVLIARLHPERRGAALSSLNLMWGVGAAGCPLLFAAFAHHSSASAAPWVLAALAGTVCGALSLRLRIPATASAVVAAGPRPSSGVLLRLTAQLFAYAGTEASVGGWVARLCQERDATHAPIALLATACFWGALLAGRALAPLLLRRVTEGTLHVTGLLIAGGGTVALLGARSVSATTVGAAITGIGLSPLFPLIASTIVARTESSAARVAGAVFALGGLGSGALPWLTGQMASASGSLTVAFIVPAAGVLSMFLLLRSSGTRSEELVPRTA